MTRRPIVFLGPSMPVTHARKIVDADYRRPIQRGDLTEFSAGQVVGIIDGVFDQALAVSPSELHAAVKRGVIVYGGASMGAIRAAEVPGVIGVGLIYEWYRDGVIYRDDEVALIFDEDTLAPLTVPTVNVRYAVERLQRIGTIDPATARCLLDAAVQLPFRTRTYRQIVRSTSLADRSDIGDLIGMLEDHDLKYRDAQTVLEAIDVGIGRPSAGTKEAARPVVTDEPSQGNPVVGQGRSGSALVWESGDKVSDDVLFEFLVFTGAIERYAQAPGSHPIPRDKAAQPVNAPAAQAIFRRAVRRWGWLSTEEARVTLADLGIELVTLNARCEHEAGAQDAMISWAAADQQAFRASMRAAMFLHDMQLKREIMRVGGLCFFASLFSEPADSAELAEARKILCKVNRVVDFHALQRRWAQWGLTDDCAQAEFIGLLARARRSGRQLAAAMAAGPAPEPRWLESRQRPELVVGRCPKPSGETRFCLPLPTARRHAARLAEVIGVTRIGMVGELGDLGGIQIAQASRPGGAWSSTYGSGKGLTEDGAYVGSVMEELEKWAQERFAPREEDLAHFSYEERASAPDVVDPSSLALPYDTCYTPDLNLPWLRCLDALTMAPVYVPLDVMQLDRRIHDICYSNRGARKVFATNGLASGFSREEALLHGVCEYVERHAQRLAEITMVNPGGFGAPPYRFIDLNSASNRVQELAHRLKRDNDDVVRVLNITSDVAIPTFMASVIRDVQRADGYGTHPDPDTAAEMALLEAAQTIASATAGGREDLTIKARSLGRHERPRPIDDEDAWFWLDPDAVLIPITSIAGLNSNDVYEDLQWALARVRAAGVRHLPVLDLTRPEIEPARVFRVIASDLEGNNPYATGARARLVLLRDLLPRWS
jgi:ribosomal protein S12 methylthiotransferase accessory factor